MKQLLLLLAIVFSTALCAQEASVIVHKDPRVDALAKKQAAINNAVRKATPRTQHGYRLLLVNTIKREEALAAKTKVYTQYPELKIYLVYQTPYFKVKAGNFQTREEAENYRKSLTKFFPKGVFIINDIIEVKAEKDQVEVEE